MWVGGDLKILRLPFAVAPLYIFTYLPREILREVRLKWEFNEKR